MVPEIIVPYADAAAVMLANLDRGNAMAQHRVGLALPVGMRGRKPQWRIRPFGAEMRRIAPVEGAGPAGARDGSRNLSAAGE